MSVRAWVYAVALGLAATSPQAQEQADGGEQGAAVEQERPKLSGFPVRVIEDEEAAQAAKRREEEAAEREKQDLVAQQSMDAAAHSAKLAAWVSAVFVAIGTGLLVWTLLLTRQANRAALAAVAVTEEVGQRQIRAYVGITEGKVALSRPDPREVDQSIRPVVEIKAKNYGNSPAYGFVWSAAVRYHYVEGNEFRGYVDPMDGFGCVDIGPGEVTTGSPRGLGTAPISDDEMAVFSGKGIMMDIAIGYAFRDVFGQRIEDERVYVGFFNPLKIGVWTTLQRHSFATIEGIAKAEVMARRFHAQPPQGGGSE